MSGAGFKRVSIAFMIGGSLQSRKWWKRARDRIITWWTGHKYTHCELVFWKHDGTWATFTVNYGQPMKFYENKRYDNNVLWKLHDISMTGRESSNMYKYCTTEWEATKSYNKLALWWNFAPILRTFPVNRRGKKWFCSEFTLAALQYGKSAYLEHRPWMMTPDELFYILKGSHNLTIGGGPGIQSADMRLLV